MSKTNINFTNYPAPHSSKHNEEYKLRVNGEEVFVYSTEVFWEPNKPAKIVGYAYFDFVADEAGNYQALDVEIEASCKVDSAVVRPLSSGISTTSLDKTIRIQISKPVKLTLEVNGQIDSTLHIFANPPETDLPNLNDPDLIYYPPGIHEVTDNQYGILQLDEKKKVYIAGGAILRARIHAEKIDNIKIFGRGILDGSQLISRHPPEHQELVGEPTGLERPIFMDFHECHGIEVKGIHFIDSPHWTLRMVECDDVSCKNIKMIGSVENSDGIDVVNSSNVTIEDTFIRTSDDCIAIKGRGFLDNQKLSDVSDVVVKDCVFWGDRASCIEIGHENEAEKIYNIKFENLDLIMHRLSTIGYHAIDIHSGDNAEIYDVYYDDIRVERCSRLIGAKISKGYFNRAKEYGHIHDIYFNNIQSLDKCDIHLYGHDQDHLVRGIHCRDFSLNGQPATPELFTNTFVKDFEYKEGEDQIIHMAESLPPLKFEAVSLPEVSSDDLGLFELAQNSNGHDNSSGIEYKITPSHAVSITEGCAVELALDVKSDYLFFLHACMDETSAIGEVIWEYLITYEDGSQASVPCRYNLDVTVCTTWAPGGWMTLLNKNKFYTQKWCNPKPEKIIEKIRIKKAHTDEKGLLLALSLGRK